MQSSIEGRQVSDGKRVPRKVVYGVGVERMWWGGLIVEARAMAL